MKKFIAVLFLSMPISLFSQNIDLDILKAIHNPEPVPSDEFFRFVSDANIYIITVGLGHYGHSKCCCGMTGWK